MSRMRLEEVTDEYDLQHDDQYTDVSDSSSESESLADETDIPEETLFERISALRDMIPPPTRAKISGAITTSRAGLTNIALFGGKGLWAITSSLLLLGIPFMMAVETEAQAQEEERALSMQTSGTAVMGNASSTSTQQQPVIPQGVRPPGF